MNTAESNNRPLKVSVLTGKLKGFKALNTNTLSNPYCIKAHQNKNSICSECYSIKMLEGLRKNCIPAWENNSIILSTCSLSEIEVKKLNLQNEQYFRYDAHGELINEQHFYNLVAIAKYYPKVNFRLWTKRNDIVNECMKRLNALPDNFKLIFSNSKVDKPLKKIPKYFYKTFNNVSTMDNTVNCKANCMDCLTCYDDDVNADIQHIIEVKK